MSIARPITRPITRPLTRSLAARYSAGTAGEIIPEPMSIFVRCFEDVLAFYFFPEDIQNTPDCFQPGVDIVLNSDPSLSDESSVTFSWNNIENRYENFDHVELTYLFWDGEVVQPALFSQDVGCSNIDVILTADPLFAVLNAGNPPNMGFPIIMPVAGFDEIDINSPFTLMGGNGTMTFFLDKEMAPLPLSFDVFPNEGPYVFEQGDITYTTKIVFAPFPDAQ